MAIRRRKPTKSAAPDEPGLDDELATVAAVLVHYPAGTVLFFGSPSRCPECGDYGLVGEVAHDVGRCTNHCRVCRRDWTITRRALRAHRDAPTRPIPIGRGVLYEALRAEPEPEVADLQPVIEEPVTEPEPVPEPEPVAPPVLVAPEPIAPPAPEPVVAARPLVDLSSSSADPGSGVDRLHVLVVGDDPFDLTVIEDLLDPYLGIGEVQLTHRATRAEGEHVAMSRPLDVVVLDLDLPDSSGLATLLEWQHLVPLWIPLIALTEVVDAELIREARAIGVSQVIDRPQLEQLASQGPAGQDRLLELLRKAASTGAPALAAPQRF